jgi:hypothetical protein
MKFVFKAKKTSENAFRSLKLGGKTKFQGGKRVMGVGRENFDILDLFLVKKRGPKGRIYWALIVPFENFSLSLYISFFDTKPLHFFQTLKFLLLLYSEPVLFHNLIFEPILQRHI